MQTETIQPRERILVALDASPQSLAALQAAAQLAAAFHAELHGLFVEDRDLLQVCALPFTREIGSFSAQPRPLDSQIIERQLRARATGLRRTVAQVANALQIEWSFRVARGHVTDELLAEAENALLLSLGRVGQSYGNTMGTTAQAIIQRAPRPVMVMGKEGHLRAPLTLLFTHSPSAQRAFQLALRLAQQNERELQVVIQSNQAEPDATMSELAQTLTVQGIRGRFTLLATPESLRQRLLAQRVGTLILPAEKAALLAQVQIPVIVVP